MRRKIETVLPFALIAAVIVITAVCALHSRSARSEETAGVSYVVPEPPYDPGPYGIPPEELKQMGSVGWDFSKVQPLVPLKDLPPLPAPFGTGKRVRPDGTVQTSGDIQSLPPELQEKIAQLKARSLPGFEVKKAEGN
jgi:hypothetical protein